MQFTFRLKNICTHTARWEFIPVHVKILHTWVLVRFTVWYTFDLMSLIGGAFYGPIYYIFRLKRVVDRYSKDNFHSEILFDKTFCLQYRVQTQDFVPSNRAVWAETENIHPWLLTTNAAAEYKYQYQTNWNVETNDYSNRHEIKTFHIQRNAHMWDAPRHHPLYPQNVYTCIYTLVLWSRSGVGSVGVRRHAWAYQVHRS